MQRVKTTAALALAAAALAGPAAAQQPARLSQVDSMVMHFYEGRGGRLAWSDSGVVSPQARALLAAIARAADDGLNPDDYPTAAIDPLVQRGVPPDSLWHLDTLLTTVFFEYGSDVSRGRINPTTVDSLWTAAPRTTDIVRLLDSGLASGRLAAVLRTLPPPQAGYVGLRAALSRYRAIVARGGWSSLPNGTPLGLGATGHRVAELRHRLAVEGYRAPVERDAERFDDGLELRVREFQERHGLVADGIVGPATLAALNVPAAVRLQQIALNLERWRWLPRSLGNRHIVVNSASFTLEIVDGGQTVVTMRAIVGRPDWPTPITTARVTDVIFQPRWYVPRTIAARELLPLVQRDPGYLAREGMRVFGDSTTGGGEVDPSTIDWTAVTESTFTYQLAQEPGLTNPLGGVKLAFWTPFDVFIHDTPARPLFSEPLRAFSHGCVRVEQAADLTAYLLPEWSVDSISAAITVGRERRVRLRRSIPLHLVYWSAWTEDDGSVEFRNDAYGWDERLAAALARPLYAAGRWPTKPCQAGDEGPVGGLRVESPNGR
jgi:murein L,D-transpeptidase YcbB/YkuD